MECYICYKEFEKKVSLMNHMRWHDLPQYKQYQKKFRRNISIKNTGDRNGLWKGDKVGLNSLHSWIKNHKLRPELCECCGKVPPYDLANISGEYKRDINDFEWLCRKCHMVKDGRIKNLIPGKNLKRDKYGRFIKKGDL